MSRWWNANVACTRSRVRQVSMRICMNTGKRCILVWVLLCMWSVFAKRKERRRGACWLSIIHRPRTYMSVPEPLSPWILIHYWVNAHEESGTGRKLDANSMESPFINFSSTSLAAIRIFALTKKATTPKITEPIYFEWLLNTHTHTLSKRK